MANLLLNPGPNRWLERLTPAVCAALAGAAAYAYARSRSSKRNEPPSAPSFREDGIYATQVEHPLPDTPLERRFGSNIRDGSSTRDVVEEASWESFPASDPPAW